MTEEKLKDVIELFAKSLMSLGWAITYDNNNKSKAINRVDESNKYLEEIMKIIDRN